MTKPAPMSGKGQNRLNPFKLTGTILAERQGFEPWRRFPAYTRSRRAPSTTRPPLRGERPYSVSMLEFNALMSSKDP